MQYISGMSRRLSILYVWGLLVFSFMENSFLTILYIFHFCLVCKLYISFPTNLFCFFLRGGRGGIGGYSVAAKFQRWILTLTHFSNVFFPNCKLYMSGLKITPCFKHGQCSIWGFLVFVFLKSASLTTTYFF